MLLVDATSHAGFSGGGGFCRKAGRNCPRAFLAALSSASLPGIERL